MSRLRPLAPALAVLVALIAVAVGVGVQQARRRTATVSATITRPAPELGPGAHLLLPNLDGAPVVAPDRPHDPAEARQRPSPIGRRRTFFVRTNAAGFRGPPLDDPPTRPRVLCLGDSVTFGWGVEDDESWPARLAARHPEFEFINAAVPAMKPDAIGAWASRNAASLRPALVLFTVRPNHAGGDPIGTYASAVTAVTRAVQPAPVAVLLPPIGTFDPFGAEAGPTEAPALAARLPGVPLRDLTADFRAALRQSGAPSGVLLRIDPGQQVVLDHPGGTERLRAAAPARGLAPEIVALFEGDPTVAEPFFFDGGHPTAEGFSVFADAVDTWLRAEGLWPATP